MRFSEDMSAEGAAEVSVAPSALIQRSRLPRPDGRGYSLAGPSGLKKWIDCNHREF
jgi:hypothetical protein